MAALSFLPALDTDDALDALRQRAVALEIRLAQLRAALRAAADAGLPRLFELEGEYEERVMETELDFVDILIKEIDDGSLDGIDLWRSFARSPRRHGVPDAIVAPRTRRPGPHPSTRRHRRRKTRVPMTPRTDSEP